MKKVAKKTVLANHVQDNVAVGGTLSIWDDRLAFTPHVVERALGMFFGARKSVDIPRADIAGFERTERSLSVSGLFAGSARRRLRVRLTDGAEELFVVNSLDKLIEFLNDWKASSA
jgi:hypothetical protein